MNTPPSHRPLLTRGIHIFANALVLTLATCALAVSASAADKKPSATDKTSPPPEAAILWLAEQGPIWQAGFEREVNEPFATAVAELNKQYLEKVNHRFEEVARDGLLDDAVILRAERDSVAAASPWPPADDAGVPALIQPMRAAYRKSLAALEAERLARARKVLARYDAILEQNVDALTRRKRIDEALAMRAKREELKATWLQSHKLVPAKPVEKKPQPEPAKTAAATTPKPATPAPPQAGAKSKQMSDAARLALITRLLDMGARIEAPGVVKTIDEVPKKNIELVGVAFNPRPRREWTEEEFAIMPELADVPNFGIEVPVTDAVMEHLRKFRTKEIRLINLNGITARGFEAVGSMPELERMTLYSVPIDDAGFRAVPRAPKLQRVAFSAFDTITDAGWAALGATNLEYMQCYVSPNVTADGWAQVAGAKKLRELSIGGKAPPGILAGISKIHSLEDLGIGFDFRSGYGDEDFASLGALPKLKVLRINHVPLTGAMFASWPERPELKVLWLPMEAKLDDAGLAALLKALPKLEELGIYFETVTDAQIQSLSKSKLPWLRLHKTTTDEVWNKLKAALPKKRVERFL